jgi:molecular chaperone GrpE
MTSGRNEADQGRRPGPATRTSADRSASESQDPITDPVAEGSGDQSAEVSEDLDALLADVHRERDEYLELAKRTKADFENYRKRAANEAQAAERRGKAALARELVPAIDNLERALRSAGVDPRAGARAGAEAAHAEAPSEEVSAHEALARGVALVYGELTRTLERAGVESFDPLGERFDPALHEALSTRPADGEDAGVVVETLERGYRLDGQVLRPARVVVSA